MIVNIMIITILVLMAKVVIIAILVLIAGMVIIATNISFDSYCGQDNHVGFYN